MEEAIEKMHKRFPLGERSKGGGTYCAVKWTTHEDGSITADLNDYTAMIDQVPVTPEMKKNPEQRVNASQEAALRTLVGTLHFVTSRTRPSEAAEINMMQSCLHKARTRHILKANKMLRRMQQTPHEVLRFARMPNDATPIVITDAALQNRPDGYTQGAYVTGLYSKSSHQFHMFKWKSKAIKKECHDSTQAEVRQGKHSLQAGESLGMQLREMRWDGTAKVAVGHWTDCLDKISNVFSLKAGFRDQRLNHIADEFRSCLKNGVLSYMGHIKGDKNPADALTKASSRTRIFLTNAMMGTLALPMVHDEHRGGSEFKRRKRRW